MKDVILNLVCTHYGVSADELRQKCRKARIIQARFTAIYLLKKWTDLNYSQITRLFERRFHNSEGNNNASHTFALYAEKSIKRCLECRDWIYRDVEQLDSACESMNLKKAS